MALLVTGGVLPPRKQVMKSDAELLSLLGDPGENPPEECWILEAFEVPAPPPPPDQHQPLKERLERLDSPEGIGVHC